MCYKEEIQQRNSIKAQNKLKDVPEFICDYFIRYGSEASKSNYVGYIKNMIIWMINQKYIEKNDISELEPSDMENLTATKMMKYLDSLKNDGKESSTIVLRKNIFSGFWNYLESEGFVCNNIIKKIPANKYKGRTKCVKIPTDYQLEDFINNINKIKNEFERERNLAIVSLFIGSGIRKAECVGLDLKDLHLDGNKPYVEVLEKGEQEEEFKERVRINKDAADTLKKYLEIRKLKYPNSKSNAVFLSSENKRLTAEGISYFFSKKSNKNIHPHMLRHYAGTKLYEASNHNIQAVKNQLGHSDVNVASKYYIADNDEDMYEALNKI